MIEATSDLLARSDTLDVSISEISALSGLNHGLVSYYFGGKEGLLLAVMERDAARALEAFDRLTRKELSGLRKLEIHIRGVIETYHRYPYLNRLIAMLQSGGARNADELSRIFIRPLQDFQRQLLDQAHAEGDIRRMDPMLFYYSVIGCCDGLFQSRGTVPLVSDYPRITEDLKQAYADHVVALILDGARPRPG